MHQTKAIKNNFIKNEVIYPVRQVIPHKYIRKADNISKSYSLHICSNIRDDEAFKYHRAYYKNKNVVFVRQNTTDFYTKTIKGKYRAFDKHFRMFKKDDNFRCFRHVLKFAHFVRYFVKNNHVSYWNQINYKDSGIFIKLIENYPLKKLVDFKRFFKNERLRIFFMKTKVINDVCKSIGNVKFAFSVVRGTLIKNNNVRAGYFHYYNCKLQFLENPIVITRILGISCEVLISKLDCNTLCDLSRSPDNLRKVLNFLPISTQQLIQLPREQIRILIEHGCNIIQLSRLVKCNSIMFCRNNKKPYYKLLHNDIMQNIIKTAEILKVYPREYICGYNSVLILLTSDPRATLNIIKTLDLKYGDFLELKESSIKVLMKNHSSIYSVYNILNVPKETFLSLDTNLMEEYLKNERYIERTLKVLNISSNELIQINRQVISTVWSRVYFETILNIFNLSFENLVCDDIDIVCLRQIFSTKKSLIFEIKERLQISETDLKQLDRDILFLLFSKKKARKFVFEVLTYEELLKFDHMQLQILADFYFKKGISLNEYLEIDIDHLRAIHFTKMLVLSKTTIDQIRLVFPKFSINSIEELSILDSRTIELLLNRKSHGKFEKIAKNLGVSNLDLVRLDFEKIKLLLTDVANTKCVIKVLSMSILEIRNLNTEILKEMFSNIDETKRIIESKYSQNINFNDLQIGTIKLLGTFDMDEYFQSTEYNIERFLNLDLKIMEILLYNFKTLEHIGHNLCITMEDMSQLGLSTIEVLINNKIDEFFQSTEYSVEKFLQLDFKIMEILLCNFKTLEHIGYNLCITMEDIAQLNFNTIEVLIDNKIDDIIETIEVLDINTYRFLQMESLKIDILIKYRLKIHFYLKYNNISSEFLMNDIYDANSIQNMIDYFETSEIKLEF